MRQATKKKNLLLIVLLIVVMGIAVGYAALSVLLRINGTATINASWNVEIADAVMDKTNAVGINATTSSAVVEDGNLVATFTAELLYPGASVNTLVTVENKGSINAILNNITYYDTAASGEANTLAGINAAAPEGIQFTVTPSDATGATTLAAGATEDYLIHAEWLATDTTVPSGASASKTISIALDYIQDT